ncbi:MAG: hypothetical protein KKD12_06775 [Proteobacteria bacterium]|nr:hypothetical protein [Pseudomonadota bacterium]MBU4288041.1 hypothetical protein [Pseudomonadota bacterium]MCG2757695.1 response regulator receiver domain [Desulfobacteraceae bacterium]
MPETFNSVASKVLKDSISTAMFIDDKALEPFEENKEIFEDFSDLYKSFKRNNCLLDIRRYKNIGHKVKYNNSLSKIDLLVLDWQLVEGDTEYLIPLQMLAKAISAKNVHFICIYTKRKNEEIEDQILYPITSYFSDIYQGKVSEKLEIFYDRLDEQGIELQNFKDTLGGLIKELTFCHYQKQDTADIISNIETALHELEIGNDFNNFIERNYANLDCDQKLICFGYELFDVPTSDNPYPYTIRISQKDKNTIYINNTLIKIRNKMETPAPVLYKDFCDSLIKDHNIFFTLFGLEMRNRFRESAAFIGAEIGSIDDIALFYHQNQVTSTEFLELLKNIWKEQASSFLYEKNIKILDVLEDYKADRRITHKVNTFRKTDAKNLENLAKINAFYNILDIKRTKKDTIKFGDIFLRDDNVERKFLLCITPHCDCLHPKENIDDMFHFIEGKQILLSDGLGKAEKEFISFIYYENHPISIEWHCRPFSIYIPKSKNHVGGAATKVKIKGAGTKIQYLCTLRENYCQRIANHSFQHPLRVGINFAKK